MSIDTQPSRFRIKILHLAPVALFAIPIASFILKNSTDQHRSDTGLKSHVTIGDEWRHDAADNSRPNRDPLERTESRRDASEFLSEYGNLTATISGTSLPSAQMEAIDDARLVLKGEEMLAFLDCVLANSADHVFSYALPMCAPAIFNGDIHGGIALMASLEPSPANLKIARAAGTVLSAHKRSDAISLLGELPNGTIRDQMIVGYNAQMAFLGEEPEPPGIATGLKRLPDGQIEKSNTMQAWARNAPLDCAEHLHDKITAPQPTAHAGEESHADDVRMLISTWCGSSPQQAAEWLATLPQGRSFDTGASVLALRLLNNSPDDALKWSLAICDPDMRKRALKTALDHAERTSGQPGSAKVIHQLDPEDVSLLEIDSD